jgi:3-phenylpropionate/cinnamic acid dioxygenase small subunit
MTRNLVVGASRHDRRKRMDGHEEFERSAYDRWAINETLVRYCRWLDDGLLERVVELFTEDARFHTMGRTLEGHDDIRAFWGPGVDQAYTRPSTAHVLSNIVADIDGDTARVESDWCMLAREEHGGTSIALAGRYRDRMQRVGASWRIAEREVVALARPAA